MKKNLQKEIQHYIIKNRDPFEKYISQTDLFYIDGEINHNSVVELVKHQVSKINSFLGTVEYNEFSKQIENAYANKQFDEILRLQFMLSLLTE